MRIAVIGVGSAGRRHIKNLLTLGVTDIIAISEFNQLAELTIGGTAIPVAHSTDAAFTQDVDIVVIANPTAMHLDLTRRAVAANKHIYLEKPAATSAKGLATLCRDIKTKRLICAIGTQNRFNPRLEEMRSRLMNGDAGTVYAVHAMLGEHIADYHPEEDYRQSYTARAALGGGVLLTQIHQIDYLNWLFGPFESVFAVGGKRSNMEIDVEDCSTYLLNGANGIAVQGHLDYLQRPKRVSVEVMGTAGKFDWDYFGNALSFTPAETEASSKIIQTPFDRNAMFLDCMRDFLDGIHNSARPRAELSDGLTALRIVDAIKESMTTHNSVRLTS
jgi:predicted dehydrogenase